MVAWWGGGVVWWWCGGVVVWWCDGVMGCGSVVTFENLMLSSDYAIINKYIRLIITTYLTFTLMYILF